MTLVATLAPEIGANLPVSNTNWMDALSSLGWAWEFLRRSPAYAHAFCGARPGADQIAAAAPWGLRYFEDPALDAARANVFWDDEASRDVLPVEAVPMDARHKYKMLLPSKLDCRVTIRHDPFGDRRDVLFAKDGLFLQLAVFGHVPLSEARLLTPALLSLEVFDRRARSRRQLVDLVQTGTMRPALYRMESRTRRLKHLVQALDGWLAQRSYREIAITMFGAARVEEEWSDPRDYLRDQVRRAVRGGRLLMEGGYRQFVR